MRKKDMDINGSMINPVDNAWRLFETTGNVNYYLLYRNLLNGIENESKK